MYDTYHHAVSTCAVVDHLALSRHAAHAVELQRAVREQRAERRAERRRSRAVRRGQEAYTTAV